MSAFLKERLFDMSDPYKIRVCKDCGFCADKNDECLHCGKESIVWVNAPYAEVLLMNDLKAMGIRISIEV